MKRFLSLLMAICLMVTICVPGASALETKTVPNASEALAFTSLDDSSTLQPLNEDVNIPTPRITVSQGVVSYVSQIEIYPAIVDSEGNVGIAKNVYITRSYSTTSFVKGVQLTTAETKSLMDRFAAVAGTNATIMFVRTTFNVVTDGKGSYGLYYEFKPSESLIAPAPDSQGLVKYTLDKATTNKWYTMQTFFYVPEVIPNRYEMSLTGAFYYYNISSRQTLNRMNGFAIYLNQD